MRELSFWEEIGEFLRQFYLFILRKAVRSFLRFETSKRALVEGLYQKRGKYARPFMHSGMMGLVLVGVAVGPIIIGQLPGRDDSDFGSSGLVLGQTTGVQAETVLSDKPRAEVLDYTVMAGDTVSSIADKFGVSLETVLWANDLTVKSKIKPGQKLKVPPVTGIAHQVHRGETIYSIAKKYDVAAQNIVNWPFNSYANDETFALAVGQLLIVPEGVKPKAKLPKRRYANRLTPDAGSVTATGQFVWPTVGRITQSPVWYHMAVDIANRAGPNVLAADSGKVVVAGAPDRYGYGIRIIIDHGNGFQTLYAHLRALYVKPGQTVSRGAVIGRMGSTGRSTGTHLHFEVRKNGSLQNPLSYLR